MSESFTSFSQLGLNNSILRAIEQVGYESPSPIQAACIPHLLEGKDVLGLAQTGTGKTAAFALPLLNNLDVANKAPQILVLTPTRELAIQVAEAFTTYASHVGGVNVLAVYGGQDYRVQLKALKRGVNVVVGTPGRIMDHIDRGTLKLNDLKAVVLDEADEMLRMGFIDDVTWILDRTPEQRQVALFSATMPKAISTVAERYLDNPEKIKITPKTASHANITQYYWYVNNNQKIDAITRLLELLQFEAMIVFVKTKQATAELADKLAARGHAVAALNGDMNQLHREKTINSLKAGNLDVVVATDVAARGIDVERISHVLNYDLPYDVESYVHRIGRTGRAGRTGEAILFATPREKRLLSMIEKQTKQTILPYQPPSNEDVSRLRIEAFKEQLIDTLNNESLEFFQGMLEEFVGDSELEMPELAAALAYMAQKENPLQVSAPPLPGHNSAKSGRERDKSRRSGNKSDTPMRPYRIEVGREHGVQPKDIVGAIANEVKLETHFIGNIDIKGRFSIVELPEGMPKEIEQHLKTVYVRNHPMDIKPDSKPSRGGPRRDRRGGDRRGNSRRGNNNRKG